MKKTEQLDEAIAPDGTVLTLYRHDRDYYIRANGIELMSTRRHHSEEKLAELTCAHLSRTPDARVLIGGLGFGFTLEAALTHLPGSARITVVELLDEIIRWNQNADYDLGSKALADPRVTLVRNDVNDVLGQSRGVFDAILLDVDNGAQSFTTSGNARLYNPRGVARAISALRPRGVIGYWSARKDPEYVRALQDLGCVVETVAARAHVTSGAWHALIIARAG